MTDRLPPHDIRAEQATLGCVLLDPRECIPQIATAPAGMFYDLRHQEIFDTCRELQDELVPVDIITIQTRLKKKGRLEAIGGISYLTSLPDAPTSAHNLESYLDTLLDLATRRNVLHASQKSILEAYDGAKNGLELLDESQQALSEIANGLVGESKKDIKSLVDGALANLERQHAMGNQIDGLTTGFADMDRITSGLKSGNMVVIAARPGMGKTSLAMNIAENVAVDGGLPVGVFSLEMTAEELVQRMLCSRAECNQDKFREQTITELDMRRMTTAAAKIIKSSIHIDDTAGLSIMKLRARARRMSLRFGVQLIVIDYLQLMRGTNKRENNREREVAEISNGVKSLAKELKIPVIVLAQLNRELDKDKNRKPRLSDLRESGAIEQDADIIGFLYERPTEGGPVDDLIQPVNLLIAKNRNGRTGDVHFQFFKEFTRFKPGTL